MSNATYKILHPFLVSNQINQMVWFWVEAQRELISCSITESILAFKHHYEIPESVIPIESACTMYSRMNSKFIDFNSKGRRNVERSLFEIKLSCCVFDGCKQIYIDAQVSLMGLTINNDVALRRFQDRFENLYT